ncbi:MAG: gamma-glutamylcyclotransferase family protein [Pseudomonadota bacterium]
MVTSKHEEKSESLFVYGTLAPGCPNEHIMNDIGGEWMPATVRGSLRQAGWGAEMGFPGIDLDDRGEEIAGYIFTSNNLADNWKTLDDFEGEQYSRVLTTASLDGGKIIETWIYQLRGE